VSSADAAVALNGFGELGFVNGAQSRVTTMASIIGQRQEAKLFDPAAEITHDKMTDAQDASGTQTRDE
jgi:hypothetical protein